MNDVDYTAVAARTRTNGTTLLAAPIVVGAVLLLALGQPTLLPLLLGGAGWMLALLFRQPVALVAMKLTNRDRAASIVGWFSGPAEELVRLALVLIAISSFEEAMWAGFGWAAVEVLLVTVNVLVIAGLMTKDDPKSLEAKQLLEGMGMMTPQNPMWGLLERFSAIGLHIGFTLMLFAQPWLVLVTLPLHSVTNMIAIRYAKSHLALTELALAAFATVTLLAGLGLHLI